MTDLTDPIDRAALNQEHAPRTLASIVGEGKQFTFELNSVKATA